MYDRLKAHGAEILEKGVGKVAIENIQQIVADAFDSEKELAFMATKGMEVTTGVNSWAAFIGSWTIQAAWDKSLDDNTLSKIASMSIVQLAATAFEAGYHAGKVRAPLTEDEMLGLFGQKGERR